MSRDGDLQQGDNYRGYKILRVFCDDGTRKLELLCSCGVSYKRTHSNMRTRGSKGCDSCVSDYIIKKRGDQGYSNHPLYKTYRNMISRCYNPKTPQYQDYGGRGITVCERWLESFENFLEDVGDKESGLSLDRINNEEGYSPENTRWATQKEQTNNFRGNTLVVYKDITYTISQFAELLGIRPNTISCRLLRGWSVDEIVKGERTKEFKIPYNFSKEVFLNILHKCYNLGRTTRSIALEYNISESNLSRILRRDNVIKFWEENKDESVGTS